MTEDGDVRATLARIDERTDNTLHRVRNIENTMNAFARQRDLEALEKRLEAAAEGVGTRFDKIEDRWYKTLWGFAAGIAALVGTYIFGKL
jgi:hypothetical protein